MRRSLILFTTVATILTGVSLSFASPPMQTKKVKGSILNAIIDVNALTKALEAKHAKGAEGKATPQGKTSVPSPMDLLKGLKIGGTSTMLAPTPRVRNPFETPDKVRNRIFEVQQRLAAMRARKKKRKKKKKKRIIVSPLQNYDVKTLVVKGVVVGKGTHLAMVIAPDGETYTVKIGDIMGLQDQKVVDITTRGIVLKYDNGTTTMLSLPTEEEVK